MAAKAPLTSKAEKDCMDINVCKKKVSQLGRWLSWPGLDKLNIPGQKRLLKISHLTRGLNFISLILFEMAAMLHVILRVTILIEGMF